MDGPIDMKKMYESCDNIHDIDLGVLGLNFENNSIRGITSDITPEHGKNI